MFYFYLSVYLFIAFVLWLYERKQKYMNKYLHILFVLCWGIFLPILFIIYLLNVLVDKFISFKEW